MRRDLINRMVQNLLYNQRFQLNAIFPKSFYDLTSKEQAEVIKQYKRKRVYKPPEHKENTKLIQIVVDEL